MLRFKEYRKLTLHDPFVVGDNFSYLASGYFPIEELKKTLPERMFIPSDKVMAEEYQTVKKINGKHPFLLMFSNCYNVHDVATEINLRPYLELNFYFPIVYTNKDGKEHLCTLMPVLYLDFLLGVIGGLYLGLRKEYHPKMKYVETDTSNSFIIKNLINASFQQTSTENEQELNPFFTQIFKYPTLTYSYFKRYRFYTTLVHSSKVFNTSAVYEWNYKGSVIKNDENTFANYAEYSFSCSRAMNYNKYFHPKYPLEY